MRSISPVIATVILLLITIAAGALAYLTILGFQDQSQSSGEGAIEQLAESTQSQLKIESVSEGKIYIRNTGTQTLSKFKVYIGGDPRNITCPEVLDPKGANVCELNEEIPDCPEGGYVSVTIGTGGASQTVRVKCEELTPVPPIYTLNTFSDGSSSKSLEFSAPDSDASTKIRLPLNASVTGATLGLAGLALSTLDPSLNSTFAGESSDNKFGGCVSSGDINNDGYDELFVGGWMYSGATSGIGRTYVFWGNETGSITYTNNETFTGESLFSEFGHSISYGDINNDGYGDLLVGAKGYPSGTNTGRAYIFWGNSTGNFNHLNNYTITGSSSDSLGFSVSSGDINNDGYDEFLVSAIGTPGGAHKGSVYVFWGNSTGDFDHHNNYTIDGEADDDSLGQFISIGDINNDGYADILTGSEGWGSVKGRAYIFWGNSTGNFNHHNNYTITGENDSDSMGFSVSSTDINNDGYDDFIVGAYCYPSGSCVGRVYIFWGNSTFTHTNNYTIDGEATDDWFGEILSSGDLDNDGYGDFIATSMYHGAYTNGTAYIFWGNSTGNFDHHNNQTIDGEQTQSHLGISTSIGDLNNDGNNELFAGADGHSPTGLTYVYWLSHNYTTSPTLKPGSNVTTSWSYSGSFSTSQTADLMSALTQILSSNCTCSGCSTAGSDCILDLNVTSGSKGRIQLSNLQITYT